MQQNLYDVAGVNTLSNLNMKNLNTNDPLSPSQKIRNAIVTLLTAVAALIAAEAGAVASRGNTQSYAIEKH
ncbi:hypothetical protein Bealeia1_01977 (plasmid) [Candidatus Bealeia paramacronuclearis]|uniref:ESPR domain-containing protein n=1 Tax=Candidatus Bealeia paramacronuclearis TaxID=1921001 RepID=A0ABZ2C719_9PROT